MNRAQRLQSDDNRAIAATHADDVGETDIARLAFELFERRGGEHGHDIEDWLAAERELRETVTTAA